MALEYFLYCTTYGNTLVCRSNSSFAPLPPNKGEIYYDILIPETQPLYLYRETGSTIVVNPTENVDAYLSSTGVTQSPTADGNVTYGEFTGTTAALSATTTTLVATAITGATNLGSGNAIYTAVSGNKIQLKSLSAGTGVSITNTANIITICSTSSGGSGITGATNGLTKYDSHNVCLGGALTNHTTITSGNFIYCIAGTQSSYYQNNSSVCLSMNGASAHQLRVSGCGASVESCCSKLLVYSGGTTFTSGAVSDCAGIKYAANYSATYTDRSLIDRGYALGQFAPKAAFNTYTGTTAPAAFASKSVFNSYTGTTAPATYQTKSSINTLTGTTLPATYVNKTQYNAYTGATATAIGLKLDKSVFNTYTGTTAPNTYLSKSAFNTYSGTTVPANYYNKTQINTYTGATLTLINGKQATITGGATTIVSSNLTINRALISDGSGKVAVGNVSSTELNYLTGATSNIQTQINARVLKTVFSTYTGTTAPAAYAPKAAFNTYTGTTAPATYVNKTQYNAYTGATATAIGLKLDKSVFNTYTGTTAPATYLTKSAFNTYSGTTVPANYYNKTQINTYTGATATAIGLKANITSPTFLVSAFAPTPAANNNSTCIATTAWYFGQCGTATPLMDGTAAVGTSALWAHQDHVHPRDTSKLSLSGGTMTGTLNGTIVNASTCLCSPITCGSTCVISPLVCGSTKVQSPIITGSTCSIAPITIGTTCVCSPRILGSISVCSPIVSGSTCVTSPIVCGGTRVQTALLCSTGQVKGTIITGSTCSTSPITCGTTCVISPITIGSTCVCSPIVLASTCMCSPTICSSTCLCSAGTTRLVGATTVASTLNVSGATRLAGALTALSTLNVSGNTTLSTTARSVTPITTDCSTCIATTAFVRNYLSTLSGGSTAYYYSECTTTLSSTSGTPQKYLGFTGTTMPTGRYQIDFTEQVGQASSNSTVYGRFQINGVTQGSDFLLKMNQAGFTFTNTLSRDVNLTTSTNCFDMYYWAGGGTACATFASLRIRKV